MPNWRLLDQISWSPVEPFWSHWRLYRSPFRAVQRCQFYSQQTRFHLWELPWVQQKIPDVLWQSKSQKEHFPGDRHLLKKEQKMRTNQDSNLAGCAQFMWTTISDEMGGTLTVTVHSEFWDITTQGKTPPPPAQCWPDMKITILPYYHKDWSTVIRGARSNFGNIILFNSSVKFIKKMSKFCKVSQNVCNRLFRSIYLSFSWFLPSDQGHWHPAHRSEQCRQWVWSCQSTWRSV